MPSTTSSLVPRGPRARVLAVVTAAVAALAVGAGPSSAARGQDVAALAPTATGTYYALPSPTRVIDTRKDGSRAPMTHRSTKTLQIGGAVTVPSSGVSAVVVNLTATQTSRSGYMTLYPAGASRPTASSLNFPGGWTGANLVTVPLGADGKLAVFNYGGTAHLILDVLGWYAKDDSVQATRGMGAQFQPNESGDPDRLYDSREDPAGAFVGGEEYVLTDTWSNEAEADAVVAYALNITAVGATKPGVLTAYSGSGSLPTSSSVNYEPGVIAPNMTVVPASHPDATHTRFAIRNTSSGLVHMVVDRVGFYLRNGDGGFRFRALAAPTRILDTRTGNGLSGPFGKGTRSVVATSVSTPATGYVVGTVTGVQPTRQTYLTVWSGVSARPTASNLNVAPGRIRAASTFAPVRKEVSGALRFSVYNDSGSMHVLFDAAGTLEFTAPEPALAARDLGAGAGRAETPVRSSGARR